MGVETMKRIELIKWTCDEIAITIAHELHPDVLADLGKNEGTPFGDANLSDHTIQTVITSMRNR